VEHGLAQIGLGWIALFLTVVLLGSAEFGYWLARRMRSPEAEDNVSELGTVQGAVLGLLALLLGFTFSMAAERYQSRKALVVREANAIGTSLLRAEMLPEPQRTNVKKLLREYVDTRIALYGTGGSPAAEQAVEADTERLQGRLWAEAVAAVETEKRPVITGLFVQTLNETIDLHTLQLAALANRIPAPIFLMLCFVACVALGLIGYGNGYSDKRHVVLPVLVTMLVAAVILVIIDLHRPTEGFIKVSTRTAVELRNRMDRAGSDGK
jgi:hypothetical protein